MSKILITRPQKISEKIAQDLAERNIPSLIQPLFSIVKIEDLQPLKTNPQAILITSSSALFALEKLQIAKKTLIISVGQITSRNLKKLGYQNIITANNNAASLLEIVLEKLDQNSGEIIYLSGEIITLDLAKELQKKGFQAQRIIVYKTLEIEEFSSQTISSIKQGEISEVWLYSKNSAKIFHKLIKKHNLVEYLNRLKIVSADQLTEIN